MAQEPRLLQLQPMADAGGSTQGGEASTSAAAASSAPAQDEVLTLEEQLLLAAAAGDLLEVQRLMELEADVDYQVRGRAERRPLRRTVSRQS